MKAEIVAEDERETGRRALLNLGHTFAHALEAETGFGEALKHGEAVGHRHGAGLPLLGASRQLPRPGRRPRRPGHRRRRPADAAFPTHRPSVPRRRPWSPTWRRTRRPRAGR
ncbi:MAG: hypothetical protein WDM85_02660 [Caulobacteraceae bacterium]